MSEEDRDWKSYSCADMEAENCSILMEGKEYAVGEDAAAVTHAILLLREELKALREFLSN